MKKQLFLSIFLVLMGFAAVQAQSISICAISSGGDYGESASGSISCTVGQIVFMTQSDPSGFLTQGFQQPPCPPAGTACDDSDPCTINDVEDGNCLCVGVAAPNTDPVSDAGGPYTILINGDVQLDGTNSSDPDAACGDAIVSFSWDINNDATFGDVTGDFPYVTWATLNSFGINAAGVYTIQLQVTDGAGATHTASTTLTITDSAVPALGTWGLILLALVFLCVGSIELWTRKYGFVLQTAKA